MPTIDLATILAPLPGDNPAGVDMRYQPLYDEIKEARRADDLLDRGEVVAHPWPASESSAPRHRLGRRRAP